MKRKFISPKVEITDIRLNGAVCEPSLTIASSDQSTNSMHAKGAVHIENNLQGNTLLMDI